MSRINWKIEDSIEQIAVNNKLDYNSVLELFRLCKENKGKTIAYIEMILEHNKTQRDNMKFNSGLTEFFSSPFGLQMLNSMGGYLNDMYEMDKMMRPQSDPKTFGEAYNNKRKHKK